MMDLRERSVWPSRTSMTEGMMQMIDLVEMVLVDSNDIGRYLWSIRLLEADSRRAE